MASDTNPTSGFINPLTLPPLPGLGEGDEDEVSKMDIEQYFTRKELNAMSDYEKMRYRNIMLNHVVLHALGMKAIPKPYWMDKKRHKRPPPPADSTDTDQEWTPAVEAVKNPRKSRERPVPHIMTHDEVAAKLRDPDLLRKRRRKKPIPEPSQTLASRSAKEEDWFSKAVMRENEQAKDCEKFQGFTQCEAEAAAHKADIVTQQLSAQNQLLEDLRAGQRFDALAQLLQKLDLTDSTDEKAFKRAVQKFRKTAPRVKKVNENRYPKRSIPMKNYAELEVPAEDMFYYCEDCDAEYLRECPEHPLTVVLDTCVPKDQYDPERAMHSVPNFLEIRPSKIPRAGLGVWSKTTVPKGVRFGPYYGNLVRDPAEAECSGYAWEILRDRRSSVYMDAGEESDSNWLRFVNCARHEGEQNLLAYQYDGAIYYRTRYAFPAGQELLVWYGSQYARELGIQSQLPPSGDSAPGHHTSNQNVEPPGPSSVANPMTSAPSCPARTSQPGVVLLGNGETTTGYLCTDCDRLFDGDTAFYLHRKIKHGESLPLDIYFKVQSAGTQSHSKRSEGMLEDHRVHGFDDGTDSMSLPDNEEVCIGTPIARDNSHFQCTVCGEAFNQSSDLTRHTRTHTGEKPYKCTVCGKAFRDPSTLTTHTRTHTGEKPFKCTVCGEAFSVSSNLTVHTRTHTGEKPFTCTVCGEAFSRSDPLTRHTRTHTGEKPFKCTVCGKAFSESGHLTKHTRTHTGEKPFKCTVCGKAFSQSCTLTKHTRTHTGEKPFKCTVCGEAFSRSDLLTTHTRTHTGEKPFKCTVCGEAFSQSGHLTTHTRTHTGEKPFKCTVCGEAFSQSGHLTKHTRTHTGEKPFKCTVCGEAFSRSSDLITHTRTHTA